MPTRGGATTYTTTSVTPISSSSSSSTTISCIFRECANYINVNINMNHTYFGNAVVWSARHDLIGGGSRRATRSVWRRRFRLFRDGIDDADDDD